MITVKNKVQEKLISLRHKLFPIPQDKLFPYDVIVHFSYHKCLTVYYSRVMKLLSKEFNIGYKHFNSNITEFINYLPKNTNKSKKYILGLNGHNNDIPFDTFPNYKGSHFIRDPRDLIVSGYKYHLWTQESWCNNSNFNWKNIINHPYFLEYVAKDKNELPHNISYKNYLNKFDKETGIILELIRLQPHLTKMQTWNFNNSNIIEKKYEDIIGNEIECFRDIFVHYGFCPEMITRGLQIVEMYSLKNRPKTDKHIRKGLSSQWMLEFSPFHKRLFKELTGNLLITLGYEQDMNW